MRLHAVTVQQAMSTRTEQTDQLTDHMFRELESPSKPLTQWEEGFLASVKDQWERKRWLSGPQFETLEKIYAEKTA